MVEEGGLSLSQWRADSCGHSKASFILLSTSLTINCTMWMVTGCITTSSNTQVRQAGRDSAISTHTMALTSTVQGASAASPAGREPQHSPGSRQPQCPARASSAWVTRSKSPRFLRAGEWSQQKQAFRKCQQISSLSRHIHSMPVAGSVLTPNAALTAPLLQA